MPPGGPHLRNALPDGPFERFLNVQPLKREFRNAPWDKKEKNTLHMTVSSLQSKATQQARDMVWEQNNAIEQAQINAVNELNKMNFVSNKISICEPVFSHSKRPK